MLLNEKWYLENDCLVYQDTIELKAGLESSDTGERRAAALDSFNSNLDQLTDKISEVVAAASS